MDYQEKLRLAKEALNSSSYDKRTIEYIFPELKENKDEMIRNFLISKMKEVGNVWKEYSSKDIIAWLEKQGEQKSNEIRPIFRVGDYIKNKNTSDKVVIEQLNVESEVYYYTSYDGAAVNHSDFPFSRQDEWKLIGQKVVEQNHTDKVEPKFKVGDTIIEKDLDEYDYETIKDIKDGKYIFTDGYGMNIDEQEGWQLVKTPAKIEQKPAWSEEDEKHYQGCLHVMNIVLNAKPYPYYNDYLWLKSIKERIKGE